MDNNNNNNKNNNKNETPIKEGGDHLVIMQHGLHGTFEDFNTIKSFFEKEKRLDNCIFITAKSNSYFLATHDGIDKIGERLFKEVKEMYEKYNRPKKISMIGHSLGGLIVRYSIGLLYKDGFFEHCKPDQFISLSSPHCGSRRPSTTVFNKVAHIFVDNFLSVTGKQLILHDSDVPNNIKSMPSSTSNSTSPSQSSSTVIVNKTKVNNSDVKPPLDEPTSPSMYTQVGNNEKLMIVEKKEENEIVTNDQEVPMPLLVRLSEGIFFNGLKMFRKRVLYSNIYNDVQVNFCTSDISAKNPYTLGKLMKFSEKYKHIIEEESILDIDPELLPSSSSSEQQDNNNNNDNATTTTTTTNNKNNTTTTTTTTTKSNHHHKTSDSDIDQYFSHDATHGHLLKKILKNLNQLHFVRYHMYFKNFLSHTNVIVKREWINSEGFEIVDHLISHFES